MITKLTHITILVDNIDNALDFYIGKFEFKLKDDVTMPDGFRWVTVSPAEQPEIEFALLPASEQDKDRVGNQVGSSSIGVLETKDCIATYQTLKAKGVKFEGEPKAEPWGTGVVMLDLYDNKFYLNQPT
ncbi:hypothetical protein A3F06_03110 [candidate division TM6 bacterium RIFCSPHIGHO2_12_FULL_36_22]|nr:MAG: hypothetical protein A3F06_03110 [candidate division TM6 bacterium RIFCSPHIGHO2_12_FULL_36_22]